MNDKIEYLKKYYKGNLDDAIKKLNDGIPVQYIVGSVNFYGYELLVDKRVLIPRRETEELVEEVIKRSQYFYNPTIIDVATGSGAIAISLSKELDKKVIASDISIDALDVAYLNNKHNNSNVEFLEGNMLDPFISMNIKVDILVSNPPYISRNEEVEEIVNNNEPNIALYADKNGLEYYEEILKNASKILNDKYLIAFEIGMNQACEIRKIAKKYFPFSTVEVKKDLSQKDRMLFVYNY